MSAAKKPKGEVSEKRVTIKLPGGRFEAEFRPVNFDELVECFRGLPSQDVEEALLPRLVDAAVVRHNKPLAFNHKLSYGYQLLSWMGNDLVAREVVLDETAEIPDDVADALEEKRSANPAGEYACLEVDGEFFLFLEPPPNKMDAASARKKKTVPVIVDNEVVDDLCFYPRERLDELRRDRPWAIVALAKGLFRIAGLSLEAELGEA